MNVGQAPMDDILRQMKQRLATLGLSVNAAARQIGVTSGSLQRHLDGAYVRSDSLAKYRAWLDGRQVSIKASRARKIPTLALDAVETIPANDHIPVLQLPKPLRTLDRPFNVVDLFSGCGGMSLGFELLGSIEDNPEDLNPPGRAGAIFQTVLSLDVEEKVVRLQNDNHPPSERLSRKPARWVDLAAFENEAEMLAFYLDHLAASASDHALAKELNQLEPLALGEFKALVRGLDAAFLAKLQALRSEASFRKEYGRVDSTVFGQTSVIGFHKALTLPETSTSQPTLGPLIWAEQEGEASDSEKPEGFSRTRTAALIEFRQLWDAEVEKLRQRTAGTGKGQLASSAARIGRFLDFLGTESAAQIRTAWLDWSSSRAALRRVMFTASMEQQLRTLYTGERRVDVLLGGPPCQGFSRIGRGKIRSLRDHQVHVQADAEAGDVRNLLLLKYVEFVSALEPRVFLFENVRHFQASVKTPEGTFQATDILKDAIRELSHERLSYHIADRIVDCSRHLIPQTRERFVMAGIRSDVAVPGVSTELLPAWCLALPAREPIPLKVALDGLPAPLKARGQRNGEEAGLAGRVTLTGNVNGRKDAAGDYLRWIRQALPAGLPGHSAQEVDGHYIRDSRPDDRAFFELLGPGRRWMDYRCDDSPTLQQLRQLLEQLRDSLGRKTALAFDAALVDELLERLDGSLSIRLLLEAIPPQEGELQHHLLTPAYLAKREGNNGDWIARLHPDRPAKTIVSHMAKDTYAYVHPTEPRTISVREAARIQTFPDWFRFGELGLVDAFRAVGNAVPPLLSHQFAVNVARLLGASNLERLHGETVPIS